MIRLHLLAIPHTITTNEFSHCAFTGKVLRFSRMMRSRGYEVFHYGVETSQSGANVDVQLLTKTEWETLRIESIKVKDPSLTDEKIQETLLDKSKYVGDLGNVSYPIYTEFNRRLRIELEKHYRSTSTDIVCLPFGVGHEDAVTGKNYVVVESGIGYPNSYKNYRIFESYAQLHSILQKDGKGVENYWFVCPNYYNVNEWKFNPIPTQTIGYFGRLELCKGMNIVVEVAKLFPNIRVVICGQGDPTPFVDKSPNIVYKPPIHSEERSEYLGSLTCLLTPSTYVEPFCGVSVEAQLCGTPVIGHDCGAFVENIEPFKTGMLCHTLSDFKYSVQLALDGHFDRAYVRERAIKLFDMYNVANRYDHAFKSILQIHNGNNGWYSPECFTHYLKR